MSPSIFRVDLANLDASGGAPVRELDLGTDDERILSGEVSGLFLAAEPFPFRPADRWSSAPAGVPGRRSTMPVSSVGSGGRSRGSASNMAEGKGFEPSIGL